MTKFWDQAQTLLDSLPRDPGTGGDGTVQTLIRQQNQLLAILIVRMAALGAELGHGESEE